MPEAVLRRRAPRPPAVEEDAGVQPLVRRMLALPGEDPDREGLLRTPERVERSLSWLTRGYGMSVEEVVGEALFREAHDNMVLVRDIDMYSMCGTTGAPPAPRTSSTAWPSCPPCSRNGLSDIGCGRCRRPQPRLSHTPVRTLSF